MAIKDGTYKAGLFRDGSFGLRSEISMGKGYWVSDDSGVTIEGEPDDKAIADALSLMEVVPDEYIGIWTDNGITYVDRSYHFLRLETAVAFGKLFDQLAIWDCAKRESIRLVGEIED